ncbi:MAG: histidine ammonia-lyase, partial [Gaiellales bacterium]|nr:histidine ammonia-lyase [Gaiellales bacterium]
MIEERSLADPLVLDDALTIDELADVALRHRRIELSDSARTRIAAARRLTEDMLAGDRRVYGLTTGVGALKRVRVG